MKLLAGLVVALIVYGSLFPFAYVPHAASFDDVAQLLSAEARPRLAIGDVLGNVLLFVPFGLLTPFVARAPIARMGWCAAGLLLAWSVQYLQFWFPPRVPSIADAMFNMLGLGFGAFAGIAMSRFAASPRMASIDAPSFWLLPTLLMACWICYRWFPLVPTLDFQNIKDGLKPLLLDPQWDGVRTLHDCVAWVVWFRLARYSLLRGLPFGTLVFLSIGVVCAEPLFWRNTVSVSNVAGVLFAAAIGAPLWRGKLELGLLTILLMLSIVLSGLIPFEPLRDPVDMAWMPFSGFLRGSMIVNTAALLEKLFFYGSAVFLLVYLGWAPTLAGLSVAATLFAVEFFQRWMETRSPEITDALLALLFAALCAQFVSVNLTKTTRADKNTRINR